ncbi:MAG: formylglycine-generating enzyme family protein [Treponema sp.]|nr:formylglycine-generating enzyme family protein [Treponema sp.]
MRLKRLRYTLAVGACAIFLFSGCATTQVKDLNQKISELEEELASEKAKQGLENQKISELEEELASEKAKYDQERVLLNDEISTLRGSTGSSARPGSVQANEPNAREGSIASLQAELARLRLLNEILLEASAPTIKPVETLLSVGTGRIRVTPAVSNSGFLGFLSAMNRPDDRGRASSGSAQAVGVSWLDAVRYCNWLSAQWQYDAYYSINGTEVQPNQSGRRNGYRLPSQAELDASVRNGFLSTDAVSRVGLLSSELNRAYRYDRTRNSLVPLDASLPVNNIGFMVVRNEN